MRMHGKAVRTEPKVPQTNPDRIMAFLTRFTAEFTAVLSLPNLLGHVLRVLREEVGFDSCALALVDDHDQDNMIIRAASGLCKSFRGLAVPRGKGLHWKVMESGTPLLVPDMQADPRLFKRDGGIRSGIYAPLRVRGHSIGVLSAYQAKEGAFTDADLNLLTVVARYLAGAVEVARLHEQLRELAATDSLTGLANRRSFLIRLVSEMARSRRAGGSLSVVLMDLDGFKAINDIHGHVVGDEVLILVAATLRCAMRASDLAARFGGDEFILMLPETSALKGEQVLDRLKSVEIAVPNREGGGSRLTFCWGVATFPEDGQDPDRLLQVADTRLYAMKQRLYGGSLPRPQPP